MANKVLENNRLIIADEFRQAGLSEVAIAGKTNPGPEDAG